MMKNWTTRLKSGLFGCLLLGLAFPSVSNWTTPLMADIGLEQAIRLAKDKQQGSRVLSAVYYTVNGKKAYNIKVLVNGRVKIIRLDAYTGNPIINSRTSNAYPNNRR